jgi:hypothetical protein
MPRLTGRAFSRLKPLLADGKTLAAVQYRFDSPERVRDELLTGLVSAGIRDDLSILSDPALLYMSRGFDVIEA